MRKLLAVLVLAAACRRDTPTVRQPHKRGPSFDVVHPGAVRDASERGNLLNMVYGASIVSRTAEMTLEQSAVRAIDGDPQTTWTSPPDDGPNQVVVFALPTLTRAKKVGIQTPPIAMFHVNVVQLDASIDGVSFSPLATIKVPADAEDPELVPVDRNIVYLRMTTLDAPGKFARVNSVHVHGDFAAPVRQAALTGCWTANDLSAQFASDRGRVMGTLAGARPVSFDGGSDGLVYRFVWVSGPDRGFAAIDTAPDGKHFSGLRWYEEPMEYSSSESWFGERSQCTGPLPHQDVISEFVRWKHRVPLYSLHFDSRGALDEVSSAAGLEIIANFARQPVSQKLRLVSREYRFPDAEQNRRAAQARLDSLRAALQKRGIDAQRFEWSSPGSENPPSNIETEIQRNLYSAVELQAQ